MPFLYIFLFLVLWYDFVAIATGDDRKQTCFKWFVVFDFKGAAVDNKVIVVMQIPPQVRGVWFPPFCSHISSCAHSLSNLLRQATDPRNHLASARSCLNVARLPIPVAEKTASVSFVSFLRIKFHHMSVVVQL